MINRWKVADFEYIPAFEVDPEGEWIKFEDAQQACVDSYDQGYADARAYIIEALGIKND